MHNIRKERPARATAKNRTWVPRQVSDWNPKAVVYAYRYPFGKEKSNVCGRCCASRTVWHVSLKHRIKHTLPDFVVQLTSLASFPWESELFGMDSPRTDENDLLFACASTVEQGCVYRILQSHTVRKSAMEVELQRMQKLYSVLNGNAIHVFAPLFLATTKNNSGWRS